jgi:hypothetical protein
LGGYSIYWQQMAAHAMELLAAKILRDGAAPALEL